MSYFTQRPLTEDEQAELASLNAAVTAAIEARRYWLDDKMRETSRLQVGDDIYDVQTGSRMGKVVELYRYHRDRDEGVRDTDVSCDYRYETCSNSFDNTSRWWGRHFGTSEDVLRAAESAAKAAEERVARLRKAQERV